MSEDVALNWSGDRDDEFGGVASREQAGGPLGPAGLNTRFRPGPLEETARNKGELVYWGLSSASASGMAAADPATAAQNVQASPGTPLFAGSAGALLFCPPNS